MNSKTRISQLNNGLKYILQSNDNVSSVSIIIVVRYGSASNKISGLAHLLEHLVFKGTDKRPSTSDLMIELDKLGGIHNAYTSKTFTAYYIKVAKEYLENALDLLSDIITNPKFLKINNGIFKEEFEAEKKIVEKELLTIKDNYSRYLHELIEKNIFIHPLDLNFEDDLKSLNDITLDDVKNAYVENYYPKNMIVSIYGNLENFDLLSLLDRYLGKFNPKGDFIENPIYRKEKDWRKIEKVQVLKVDKVQNANLAITFKNTGYLNKNNYYMNEIFSTIFSDITSSRLFQCIREKLGLVYSIKSSNYCYDYVGYYSITTNTHPNNLNMVVRQICNEINKVKKNGLTEEELELAKKNYLGKLALNMEDTMNIAEYNAYELFYNKNNFFYYSDINKIINDITLENINNFISDLFNKPSTLTVIKPE